MARVKIKRKEYLLNDFSDYVSGEMKRQHITQADLARRLGMTQANLSLMIRNKTYTLNYLVDIFEALNTSEEQIGRLLKL